MELTKKQRILYDFFVKYGKEVGTIKMQAGRYSGHLN